MSNTLASMKQNIAKRFIVVCMVFTSMLLCSTVASAQGFSYAGFPVCQFAPGVVDTPTETLQITIAGDDTRTCGGRENGKIAAVYDAQDPIADCAATPVQRTGGGNRTVLLQWDDSFGAAGEWKCVSLDILAAQSSPVITFVTGATASSNYSTHPSTSGGWNVIDPATNQSAILAAGASDQPNYIGSATAIQVGPIASTWPANSSYIAGSAFLSAILSGRDSVNNALASVIVDGNHSRIDFHPDASGHNGIGWGSVHRITGACQYSGIGFGTVNEIKCPNASGSSVTAQAILSGQGNSIDQFGATETQGGNSIVITGGTDNSVSSTGDRIMTGVFIGSATRGSVLLDDTMATGVMANAGIPYGSDVRLIGTPQGFPSQGEVTGSWAESWMPSQRTHGSGAFQSVTPQIGGLQVWDLIVRESINGPGSGDLRPSIGGGNYIMIKDDAVWSFETSFTCRSKAVLATGAPAALKRWTASGMIVRSQSGAVVQLYDDGGAGAAVATFAATVTREVGAAASNWSALIGKAAAGAIDGLQIQVTVSDTSNVHCAGPVHVTEDREDSLL